MSIKLDELSALAVSRQVLLEAGFEIRGKSRKSPSLYLGIPGYQFQLRISNHAKTAETREQSPHVLMTFCVRRGDLESTIALAKRIGSRFCDRIREVYTQGHHTVGYLETKSNVEEVA